jgi:NAD(P)-dependent dehydrogenase (short-subunit alcohol dehydrogenase family)
MTATTTPGRVWITGGGTGIGRALALRMARAGWQVAISGRREAPLRETQAMAQGAAGRIECFPCDVTDHAGMLKTIGQIEAALGELDMAVLNAGTYAGERETRFSVELFREIFDTNVMGVVHGIDAVLPGFYARRKGQLVIVASVAYGASKAALINMAESLNLDLAPKGIKVTLVCPGFVKTPLTDQNRFPMPFLMDADEAAEKMYAGILSGAFEVTFPKALALPLKAMRSLPYALYFPLARKATQKK